jgi:hypothetical protein
MVNARFTSMGEIRDIEAKNEYASLLKDGFSKEEATKMVFGSSRDNVRIPMQWPTAVNGGFQGAFPGFALKRIMRLGRSKPKRIIHLRFCHLRNEKLATCIQIIIHPRKFPGFLFNRLLASVLQIFIENAIWQNRIV